MSSSVHISQRKRRGPRSVAPALTLAALAMIASLAQAATITVNSTADEQVAGDGRCTIKEAFDNVSTASELAVTADRSDGDCAAADGTRDVAANNVIVLAPAATYRIASAMRDWPQDSAITARVLMRQAPKLVVEGRGSVLAIEPGAASLRGVSAKGEQQWRELTIRGGRALSGSGGGMLYTGGGDLTLESVGLLGNQARFGGGLVVLSAGTGETLTLDRVTIAGNEAISIDGSTVGGFSLVRDIGRGNTTFIRNSTISGNRAQAPARSSTSIAGGIGIVPRAEDRVFIEDSTISGNSAVATGGNGDTVGGLLVDRGFIGQVTLSRSVISGNRGAAAAEFMARCPAVGSGAAFVSGGYNILGEDGRLQTAYTSIIACPDQIVLQTAPSDRVPPAGTTIDQILAPLADNGGSTQTHALVRGSLAIDAIPANVAEHCVPGSTDQRGIARGLDGDGDGVANCDIGAVEVNPPLLKLSASSLRFGAGLLRVGAVRVGKPSDPQVLTLRNAGGAVLNIASITTTGDFVQDSACGTTLAPGATCTVTLRFLPSRPGERSGETVIDSDAPGGLRRVALSGRGAGIALLFGE